MAKQEPQDPVPAVGRGHLPVVVSRVSCVVACRARGNRNPFVRAMLAEARSLGEVLADRPSGFSLLPRWQGLRGSPKWIARPVSVRSWASCARSAPCQGSTIRPPFPPHHDRPIESDAVRRGDPACQPVLRRVTQGRILRAPVALGRHAGSLPLARRAARSACDCTVIMVIEIPATGPGVARSRGRSSRAKAPARGPWRAPVSRGHSRAISSRSARERSRLCRRGAEGAESVSCRQNSETDGFPTGAETPVPKPAFSPERPAGIPNRNRRRVSCLRQATVLASLT